MKPFLLIVVMAAVLFSACKESENITTDVEFNLWVKNTAGENLLNPATTGYYVPDDIMLYQVVDGKMKDVGRTFEVYKNESNGEYGIKMYANTGDGSFPRSDVMLIQWSKNNFNNIDTVQTVIKQLFRDGGDGWVMTLSEISYNGDVQWDLATSNNVWTQWGDNYYTRFLEITK